MANMSSAYGHMTLKGPWEPETVMHLNTIAREIWASWHYDIQIDPFEAEYKQIEPTATFYANGRWTFCSNLESLGNWMTGDVKDKPELNAIYNELLKAMYDNGLTIEVSYSDEESGFLVLYNQTGVLSSDGSTLSYSVTSEENYDYTWENYMDVTGDEDALGLLIDSLCKQLGIKDDEGGLIERWAAMRTTPQCTDFDEISEDAQAEFNKLFLNEYSKEDIEKCLDVLAEQKLD